MQETKSERKFSESSDLMFQNSILGFLGTWIRENEGSLFQLLFCGGLVLGGIFALHVDFKSAEIFLFYF